MEKKLDGKHTQMYLEASNICVKVSVLTDTKLHNICVIRPSNDKVDKQGRYPAHNPFTAAQRLIRRHL